MQILSKYLVAVAQNDAVADARAGYPFAYEGETEFDSLERVLQHCIDYLMQEGIAATFAALNSGGAMAYYLKAYNAAYTAETKTRALTAPLEA